MLVEYRFSVDPFPKACDAEVVATSRRRAQVAVFSPPRERRFEERQDVIYVFVPRLADLLRAVGAVFPPEDVALDAIIHEIFELFTMQMSRYPHKSLVDHLYRNWRQTYWEKRQARDARRTLGHTDTRDVGRVRLRQGHEEDRPRTSRGDAG